MTFIPPFSSLTECEMASLFRLQNLQTNWDPQQRIKTFWPPYYAMCALCNNTYLIRRTQLKVSYLSPFCSDFQIPEVLLTTLLVSGRLRDLKMESCAAIKVNKELLLFGAAYLRSKQIDFESVFMRPVRRAWIWRQMRMPIFAFKAYSSSWGKTVSSSVMSAHSGLYFWQRVWKTIEALEMHWPPWSWPHEWNLRGKNISKMSFRFVSEIPKVQICFFYLFVCLA